ncbi:Cytosolic carboxypeptidase 2 [Polyrhizophydium stewartii]|uniref:Cytosolic carboxypeptidase 2 n=1 Tax=Polyrhizophydium stewartii TaxID=2732419 RepID=A0ABR4NBN1_9FUNG
MRREATAQHKYGRLLSRAEFERMHPAHQHAWKPHPPPTARAAGQRDSVPQPRSRQGEADQARGQKSVSRPGGHRTTHHRIPRVSSSPEAAPDAIHRLSGAGGPHEPEYIEASHPAPEGSQSPPDGSESSDLVEAAISLASATDLFRPASSSITSSTAPGVDGADVELDACDYDLDPLVDLFALYTRIKERRIKESANADKREKSKWALFMKLAREKKEQAMAAAAAAAAAKKSARTKDGGCEYEDSMQHALAVANDCISASSQTITALDARNFLSDHRGRALSVDIEREVDEFLRARQQALASRGVPPRLRSPRPLAVVSDQPPAPRWPEDMACILPSPDLICCTIEQPEPYHVSMGTAEPPTHTQPSQPPELVFRARFDGTDAQPFYIPRSINDDSLVFESRFESGNLKAATRIGPAEYNLEIRKDLHTSGHTQWFYFQLQNMCGNREYTFHITNLMKPRCLYTQGMQPLIYSQRQARFQGIGWTRAGSRFDYSRNPQTAGADGASKRPTFTLTFALAFPHDDDTVLVAHCYPYTYSDLQRYIASVKADARKSEFFRHRVLCKTLCQNNIDLLTITNKASDPDELSARRGIVLTARGFFDFVLGESPQAEYLRKHFIFKVIPMLNPDGVIVGNHRCNLKGYDLNRQWGMADNGIEFAPEIWHARHMITEFSRTRPLVLYCDLHGHNRKHGAFLYGCHNDADERLRFIERVFPFMLSQRLPSCIFFKRCQFQMQRRKEGTSRISLRRSLPVVNSFTLEASFCGTDLSARGAYQFQIKDYVAIGEATGLAIYDFLMSDDERAPSDTAEMLPSEHARSVFATIKQQMIKGDTNVMPEASESSDTTSDDEKLRIKPKKAKKKTKKAHAPSAGTRAASQNQSRSSGHERRGRDSSTSEPKPGGRPARPRSALSTTSSSSSLASSSSSLGSSSSSSATMRGQPPFRPRTSATVQERRARLEERKVVQVPTKIEPRRPAAALSSVVLNPPVNPLIVPHVHFGGSMHSGLRSECPIHGLAHPHKSTTFGSSGTLAAEWMRYAH